MRPSRGVVGEEFASPPSECVRAATVLWSAELRLVGRIDW